MNELVCAAALDYLMDYLEGQLDAGMRTAIETHVAGCPRCVAFVESYRATPALLRRATAAALPKDLEASLLVAIRARL